MSDFITRISTTDSSVIGHAATADELTYLGQIIDIDGREAVVVQSEAILNGSGRRCGTHLVINAEAWQFVQATIENMAV